MLNCSLQFVQSTSSTVLNRYCGVIIVLKIFFFFNVSVLESTLEKDKTNNKPLATRHNDRFWVAA